MTQDEQAAFVDSMLDKVAEMANVQDYTTKDALLLMLERFDAWLDKSIWEL